MRRRGFVLIAALGIWSGLRAASTRAESPARQATPAVVAGLFPRSAEESAAAIQAGPGLAVELFAAEPHLASPVALAFDADGDVYVAEMLDYPLIRTPGMFGPFPEGQVRLLKTEEGGRVVRSTVFATAIAAPTSVVPYDGGVLVSAAPDIVFLKDTDGDGHADVREIVLTGFDTGQDLYRVNSLFWGNDGWIYARGVGDTPIHWGDDPNGPTLSTAGMNFRFRPKTRQFEVVSGESGCFGLTMDDWGHLFFSNSGRHVFQVVLPDRYLSRNPYLAAPPLTAQISDHGAVAQVRRISAPQPWRVERSEIWKQTGLDKKYFTRFEPRQDYTTATCGPLIYRETAFPPEYRGNYFVCEAVGNLVHRDVLKGSGPVSTASRAAGEREFLASADNWCSPVYLATGPDGALYVVDMYRQLIEHAGPDGGRDVPNVPLEVLRKYGLRAGSTMGRVYRVAPAGLARKPRPHLRGATPKELADALGSPAAWWRTTAQRLILEQPEAADVGAIVNVARRSPHAAARLQALWTLEALGKLDDVLVAAALRDDSPGVRENALRLAEGRFARSRDLATAILAMVEDPSPMVRYQLAFTLGEAPSAARLVALADLVRQGAEDPYLRAAVLSAAGDNPLDLYRTVADGVPARGVAAFLSDAAQVIGAKLDKAEIASWLDSVVRRPQGRDAGPLRGLAEGIRRRGRKALDVPAAHAALAKLRSAQPDELRAAAEEVASLICAFTPAERTARIERENLAARDEDRPVEERVRAIDALGAIDAPEVIVRLGALLRPQVPEPVQLAALRALGEQSDAEVVRVLSDAWRGLTPALQAKAIEVALGRRERLGPLLETIRARKVPAAAIEPAQRARLLGSTDAAIATAARAVFGATARGLDPALFEKSQGALDLKGDPGRGAATFQKLCSTCHKSGRQGAEVGPDLASVRSRSRAEILRDILDPNLTFAPQYHQYVAATVDGRLITGLLASSSATSYTIRRQGGEEVTLLRIDVEELRDTQVSLMPEKLLEGLGPQEVADLIDFVRQAGSAQGSVDSRSPARAGK
jgi:putative membrane-bound dehydrogenase-like protein